MYMCVMKCFVSVLRVCVRCDDIILSPKDRPWFYCESFALLSQKREVV